MSTYLSLLLFALAIIWFSNHANGDKVIKKVFKNFEENLFQELDQFGSFSDKDSKAISVHQKLEPILFSRRRRSFPDDPGEQQTGDFSDKTHLNEIQNNPKHVFPDSVSNIEQSKPLETNALISDQMINKSSDLDKIAVPQSEPMQKSKFQSVRTGLQPGMNLPGETHGNSLGQQQLQQSLVKAESNVAVRQPIQSQNNVSVLQQPAQAPNNFNGLQQPAQAPNNVNGLPQPAQVPNNVNGLQQPAQAPNGLQKPAQPLNNVNGIQQPAKTQNSLAKQPINYNLLQHQQPSIQVQSNNDIAHVSEQNSLNKPVLSPNGQSANDLNQVKNNVPINQQGQFEIDQNLLPLNQQNNAVAKPNQIQQMIDSGSPSDETQNHLIDNGGLSADQQKPALINGNDQYVDQQIAGKSNMPTNKPKSPSEFGMNNNNNNLNPVHIADNEGNVNPPDNQPKVYITSQAARPGQISVTPSKVDSSSSKAPFFLSSEVNNVQKEPEHSQEFGKQDDGWYYNQEIDDSLHQGVTESEKHAGKQMLMSAHHFDIPLGALAGAKMFNNDPWQKNHKQYLVNKKSETFEPMSMALFYSWIALATLAVLAILTIFRHRHKVTGYVYDLRYWHNGGYVEEGRRLLHNAYA